MTTMPSITSTTPVARLSVLGVRLVGEHSGDTRPEQREEHAEGETPSSPAHRRWQSGRPHPVSAVKVMMKTLVPTAVLSS